MNKVTFLFLAIFTLLYSILEPTFEMETKSNLTLYKNVFQGIFSFPSAEVAETLKTGNWLKPLPLGIY